MQDIKDDRFNPEIHLVVEEVPTDVFDNIPEGASEVISEPLSEQPKEASEQSVDIPVVGTVGESKGVDGESEPPKKRRGMPKGGWPKKVKI